MHEGQGRASDPVPVFVGPVDDGQAVVAGSPEAVRLLGRLQPAPSGVMTTMRAALVTLPVFQSIGSDLGGGLVRLTEESLRLLAEHGPAFGEDGAVLGVARGADGRFAGLLAFEEVGNLATFAPNLASLVSVVVLQAQLSVIERKLEDLQTDVETLIRERRVRVLAESRAVVEIL